MNMGGSSSLNCERINLARNMNPVTDIKYIGPFKLPMYQQDNLLKRLVTLMTPVKYICNYSLRMCSYTGSLIACLKLRAKGTCTMRE